MKTWKRYWKIVTMCFFIINSCGCASIVEVTKEIYGTSIKKLELSRKDAAVKNINYDYFSCYTKVSDILKNTGVYIYLQDVKKHLIAFYLSEENTTPVGIFFVETDKDNTIIEVSSPSSYFRDMIAGKIFGPLEKQSSVDKDLKEISSE